MSYDFIYKTRSDMIIFILKKQNDTWNLHSNFDLTIIQTFLTAPDFSISQLLARSQTK
jgi:hypothetical protein